jgi:uncharacterized protein YceH (UPF0502 family)
MTREDGPFIARLPRAAGARESRYSHLFSGHVESVEEPAAAPEESPTGAPTLSLRVSQLEAAMQQLQTQLDALTAELARR